MKRIILGIILSMAFGAAAFAANDDNPIEGKLKGIYSDFITITIPSTVMKSPDINTSSGGNLDIKIDSNTAYGNFTQLSDLQQGDILSVTYNEKDSTGNKKVAERIVRTELASVPAVSSVTTTQTTVTTKTVTNEQTDSDSNY